MKLRSSAVVASHGSMPRLKNSAPGGSHAFLREPTIKRLARNLDEEKDLLGLSRRLVGLHMAGLALLILVVLSSVIWVSSEHNKLATVSSENLVRTGLLSVRTRALTLVRDYSIWDEGYAAAVANDREWLFSNIGVGVTEIGTFDLVMIHTPEHGPAFGWLRDTPKEGKPGLLPDDILDALEALLKSPGPGSVGTRTMIAELNGDPWIFAVSYITPVDGIPAGVQIEDLPRQIHGHRLGRERIAQISQSVLATDLAVAKEPIPNQPNVPLIDFRGDTIGYLVWTLPLPGASILGRIALPLSLALIVVTIVSAISSRYAVRSARRLERALVDAKVADRSKTEFLSNVSHELRTPMNGILGVAQLLGTTNLDEEQRELVTILSNSANAQMSLISDLLDLSRIETGNREMVSAPFVPESVLTEVVDMVRLSAMKRRIGFDADCGALHGLTVLGDSRAFQQIATNLLSNAVKFTDYGCVELRALVTTQGDRAQIMIRVKDTGPGIAQDLLSRIFERFYQVDSSSTREKEGTGLGLAISQELAQLMGGEIRVSSEVGAGSTFEYAVELKIVDETGSAQDAA